MAQSDIQLTTTMLFIPGVATEKFANMPNISARAFILDLEDAVPPDHKASARRNVSEAIDSYADQVTIHVRVNPIATPYFLDDMEAVVRAGITGINLPKTTRAEDVIRADEAIRVFEHKAGLPLGLR